MNVTAFFRWFDLWVGAYVDWPKGVIYLCPVPMFGFRIQLRDWTGRWILKSWWYQKFPKKGGPAIIGPMW